MKLILLTAFFVKYTGGVRANEQFAFPPHFQKPNQGAFPSDSSIFLPPESHTPIPYFPIKNINNLPFPYLPPTGTKAPSVYPSPFPVMLSSTLVPIFDDDDDKEDNEREHNLRISSPLPPKPPKLRRNLTENVQNMQASVKKEMRTIPKLANYHNPIDRIDIRFPSLSMGPTTPNPLNQSPRSILIDHRNDHGIDHIKAPSIQNPHYVAAPGFTISSTTEPAIPILRLSNEMDLDGSFSYEALGADQTHYVQHSRMENIGTDKEEQVVEGSYSYVGDNGQTYTVHYIADSNGFRASGDHLPVAPPIPEIIQRAVQYNIAEESKRPPHLKTWQSEEKDYDSSERQHFVAPPPRGLFTGRTPEAFSYSFSQGVNNDNNLAAAPSSQVPIKTNTEFIIDQTKNNPNNGPISPQITFMASQGAHVPSVNQPSQQQSISRVFTNEKPNMPQLVNYEASLKEGEQDANKGLWRWQYGLNSNIVNQTPEKNTISRSFGEGDDIMINFGEMTPDQYTKMLQSQLSLKSKESANINNEQTNVNLNYASSTKTDTQYTRNANQDTNPIYLANIDTHHQYSTTSAPTTSSINSFQNTMTKRNENDAPVSPSPIIIQSSNKTPSQTISVDYDYEENPYDFRRIKALHLNSKPKSTNNINSIPLNNSDQKHYNFWANKDMDKETEAVTKLPPYLSTFVTPTFTNVYEHKTDFKPLYKPLEEEKRETNTSTTETTTENLFHTNIFLKNLVKPIRSEEKQAERYSNHDVVQSYSRVTSNKIPEEPKDVKSNKVAAETKADKIPKYVPYPSNEFKGIKKKPLDISDVINYITMKNNFESSKIKQKSGYNNHEHKSEVRRYPPHFENNSNIEEDYIPPQPTNSLRNFNNQEHEEIRGLIKNYKVLQRNNNLRSSEQNGFPIRKEITTPSLRMLQTAGLPPLGRAGPSMKTYLPPIYV